MRLIDADALKDTICSNVYPVTDYFNSRDYGMFWTGGIEKAIDEQPTIESAQPGQRWIPVSERQPDKPGVYLVTVFNREWVGDDIMQGAKPPKDEYWDDHKNIYAGRQDGKWVMTGQRVWNGECWTGYGEIQLAWMEMPAPYTEEDNG